MKRLVLAGLILAAASSLAHAQNERGVDCENALSQNDMTYCATLDYEKADEALNIAYQQALQEAKDLDEELKSTPELVGAVAALKKSQRGWIEYRDGHCEGIGFNSRGGSMEPMLVAGCKAILTNRRTAEIKEPGEEAQQ